MSQRKGLRLVSDVDTPAPTAPPDADLLPDVLTQKQAAKLLQISVATLIRHGDAIPHKRVGCVPRYSKRLLLAWIEGDQS